MRFQDKTAIITGSTKGIGKATAELLAAEGASVVIVGTSEETGSAVAAEIQAAGGKAFFQKTDVTSGPELDALVQATLDNYGKIDILVNNAGIGGSLANMDQITDEEWDKVLTTNLTAPFQIMLISGRYCSSMSSVRVSVFLPFLTVISRGFITDL